MALKKANFSLFKSFSDISQCSDEYGHEWYIYVPFFSDGCFVFIISYLPTAPLGQDMTQG